MGTQRSVKAWSHRLIRRLTPALLIICSLQVSADTGCTADDDACIAVGEWEFKLALGLGKRTNPLADSSDIPLVLVPQVSYYGERFFIENLEFGYTIIESEQFMLNAIFTPGRDRGFFLREDINNFFVDGAIEFTSSILPNDEPVKDETIDIDDLHKRRLAGLAGIELSSGWKNLQWQVQLLQDLTKVHQGKEVRFALGSQQVIHGPAVSASVGFTWKSESLLNYYYGVTTDEAGKTPFAYEAKDGFNPFVRLAWNKTLNSRWQLSSSIQYEQLSSAISDSPLVEEDYVLQFFVGGIYHF